LFYRSDACLLILHNLKPEKSTLVKFPAINQEQAQAESENKKPSEKPTTPQPAVANNPEVLYRFFYFSLKPPPLVEDPERFYRSGVK